MTYKYNNITLLKKIQTKNYCGSNFSTSPFTHFFLHLPLTLKKFSTVEIPLIVTLGKPVSFSKN